MNKPQIVAPWWSYKKAMVASSYWADEVYIWVPFTSLRMRQNKVNGFDELDKTIEWLHANGTKALLTMNIFPKNTDIKVFESVVERLASANPDAIIFSDPGTFNIIRRYLPNVPLHLSTQTTSLNYESIKFRYDLWVKRIVLARELHINEIKEIKEKIPGVELEVFVQGAVCMAFSGRCLLWDYMWWRPGNKWECNHACRFKYKVRLEEERRPGKFFQLEEDNDWSHILSSKDLCAIERLQELIPYVDALKIEWRSKSEFYVGSTVKAYKHVRDAIVNGTEINQDIKNLVYKIPHREYRDGFLFNDLKNDFPEPELDKETLKKVKENPSSISKSPWPLFDRNYFGIFSTNFIEKDGNKYYEFTPKEVINKGMKVLYISNNHDEIREIEIIDIIKEWWQELEKANCNTPKVFILTDQKIHWREILFQNPQNQE